MLDVKHRGFSIKALTCHYSDEKTDVDKTQQDSDNDEWPTMIVRTSLNGKALICYIIMNLSPTTLLNGFLPT